MLERIRIIQIGDLHFPETASLGLPIDDKDATFPQEMKNGLSRYPLKTVFRRIYDLLAFRNEPPNQTDCVAFMGDASSYGDLDAYRQGMSYFAHALQLGTEGIFRDIPVGIVPGNHDIHRPLLDVPGSDARFNQLTEILGGLGLPSLPVHSIKTISLHRKKCEAKLILLNSCLGCGQKKHIPQAFQKAIGDAIESVMGGADSKAAIKQYFDMQLDTPAIEETVINGLSQELQDSPENQMIVIAAHHNLLPQRSMRLAPYTELVNGGVVREMLANSKRPIVYLHGHIHDDPIEIVKQPDGCPVISVSCPRVDRGFNVVEIIFDNGHKPISCQIVPYKFNTNNLFEREHAAKISLISTERAYVNSELSSLYSALLKRKIARLDDLVKPTTKTAEKSRTVENIEILFACGLIDIKNHRSECDEWILEALTK